MVCNSTQASQIGTGIVIVIVNYMQCERILVMTASISLASLLPHRNTHSAWRITSPFAAHGAGVATSLYHPPPLSPTLPLPHPPPNSPPLSPTPSLTPVPFSPSHYHKNQRSSYSIDSSVYALNLLILYQLWPAFENQFDMDLALSSYKYILLASIYWIWTSTGAKTRMIPIAYIG